VKIHVIVHQARDGLWAEVPALPHIVVNAKTQAELLEQVRLAVDLYFESAATETPPPKQGSELVRVVELTV
jgi:predicted RNase H-like HicB family nuclease